MDEWGEFEQAGSVRRFAGPFDGYEFLDNTCLDVAKFFSDIYRGRPNALNLPSNVRLTSVLVRRISQ